MLKKLPFIFLAGLFGFQAHAASFTFTSSIVSVEVDDGTGKYAGSSVGDAFSGSFVFGNRASDAELSAVSSNGAAYSFLGSSYSSTITNGDVSTSSSVVTTAPGNDAPIANAAELLNRLFGTNIDAQMTIDSLGTFGYTLGGYYDSNDVFKDGIEFGIILFLDASTYSDVGLKTSLPAPSNTIAGLFFVAEADSLGNETFRAYGSIENVSVGPVPSCDIEMNQAIYSEGDSVTADVFQLANPSAAPLAMEVKVWWDLPVGPPSTLFNLGADGSMVVPAGWEANLGPFPIHSVNSSTPRGTYEFSCRLLDPITGKLLFEDVKPYKVE